MATWKSPIFSDIRNKLGDNVVFSMWKGRPYMRSYVKPSNPDTNGQKANRLHMATLVAGYQAHIKVTPADVTLWNAAALSQLVSGYNRFIKGMRGVVLSAVTLAAGTFTLHVDSCALPVNEMQIYAARSAGSLIFKGPTCATGTYTDNEWIDAWTATAADVLWLIDVKVLGANVLTYATLADYGYPLYQVNESAGTVVPCVITA